MRAALFALLLSPLGVLSAQDSAEAFGRAVQRNLDRSHALYPEATVLGSPLSQAILFRIDWLSRNNPGFFSDPEWPVKIAATEASRLGLRAQTPSAPRSTPNPAERRYLAVVTKNFGITGVSFRKGQQIIIEALRDYGKRGVINVDGQEVVLWLDHIKLVRELPPGEPSPLLVKIVSARYGLAGTKGYVVSSAVQTALAPNARGDAEVLVSDSLLPPAAAQRLNRAGTQSAVDPTTGKPIFSTGPKILSVTYEIGGVEKSRQAEEGTALVLD